MTRRGPGKTPPGMTGDSAGWSRGPLTALTAAALAVAASYCLALAGSPENTWIWRDVLGVL